jgi:hypothetical protein
MEGLGHRMRGAIREDTGMPEQEKLSLVSDPDDPNVQGKPKREGEDSTVETLTVQTPIKRHGDDPDVGKHSDLTRVKRQREGEDPAPAPLNTTAPIQRPDPNPDPIVPPKPGSEPGEGR